MLESIKELREYIDCQFVINGKAFKQGMEIADAIHAEVDANYMEFPKDADGVPIRPDDLMACTALDTNGFDGKEHVMAVNRDFWVDKDGYTHIPRETRHVKPRTLEDVLIDAMQFGFSSHAGDNVTEKAREFADEIRELLGGDAE